MLQFLRLDNISFQFVCFSFARLFSFRMCAQHANCQLPPTDIAFTIHECVLVIHVVYIWYRCDQIIVNVKYCKWDYFMRSTLNCFLFYLIIQFIPVELHIHTHKEWPQQHWYTFIDWFYMSCIDVLKICCLFGEIRAQLKWFDVMKNKTCTCFTLKLQRNSTKMKQWKLRR